MACARRRVSGGGLQRYIAIEAVWHAVRNIVVGIVGAVWLQSPWDLSDIWSVAGGRLCNGERRRERAWDPLDPRG